jgi:hypothetical protein
MNAKLYLIGNAHLPFTDAPGSVGSTVLDQQAPIHEHLHRVLFYGDPLSLSATDHPLVDSWELVRQALVSEKQHLEAQREAFCRPRAGSSLLRNVREPFALWDHDALVEIIQQCQILCALQDAALPRDLANLTLAYLLDPSKPLRGTPVGQRTSKPLSHFSRVAS